MGRFALLSLLLWSGTLQPAGGATTFVNCRVLDGTGAPERAIQVRIAGGRITAMGPSLAAAGDATIDCAGAVLAPGFVDLHNHSTSGLLRRPEVPSQVSQGITTLVVGADGGSPFPIEEYGWRLQESGAAVNVASMVGHGTLRGLVLGQDYRRQATEAEIAAMARLLAQGLRQGAFGLSSGLEYDPGFYSTTAELIALAKVAAAHGAFYMTHMRDEEEGVRDALDEAFRIGSEAGLPVLISHLKLGNPSVAGHAGEILDRIRAARGRGVDVMADCYPYDAWSSTARILVPSRRFDSSEEVEAGIRRVGGPDRILITRYRADPAIEFQTLAETAAARDIPPRDLLLDIYRQGGAQVVVRSMDPIDVRAFYADPLVIVASDGGEDSTHPRKAGTFTKVLGRFVREEGFLTLPEAVAKMTSRPAARLGLTDRGRIEVGYAADLVMFDPDQVVDNATFQEPDRLSSGILLTIVNGVPVWKDSAPTGALPGQWLSR